MHVRFNRPFCMKVLLQNIPEPRLLPMIGPTFEGPIGLSQVEIQRPTLVNVSMDMPALRGDCYQLDLGMGKLGWQRKKRTKGSVSPGMKIGSNCQVRSVSLTDRSSLFRTKSWRTRNLHITRKAGLCVQWKGAIERRCETVQHGRF